MILAGTKLCLMGTWDSSPEPAGLEVIRLVAQHTSFAMGNGWKIPTQVFLADLENLIVPGMSVLDIGTGVGVLAIGSIRLGAANVIAVDPQSSAINYCGQNVQVNGMDNQIQVIEGRFPLPLSPADLVLCNLDTLDVLRQVIDASLAKTITMMPDQSEVPGLTEHSQLAGYNVTRSYPVRAYQYMVLEKT